MSDITTERIILASLVQDSTFITKVLPFLKREYFEDRAERNIFDKISNFVGKYNDRIDRSTLIVSVKSDFESDENEIAKSLEVVEHIFGVTVPKNKEWLHKTTEEWCRDRAVYLAIQKSIDIYRGEEKKLDVAAIPAMLSEAISVEFDSRVGSDFFEDAASRYDYYTNPEIKVPFRLAEFNGVTCGGVTPKTLNILLTGINVGKSLGLVSLSCDYLRDGFDVLYVSCEMREEAVLQRVDANILNIATESLASVGKEAFINKVETLRSKTRGNIIVKEFAPGAATALNIKSALKDLRLKRGISPKIVMVDYIQIMGSYQLTAGAHGSYYYYKAVAEELRRLAVEEDIVVWTASQFNRGGQDASDISMGDIAESLAIAATADGMWGLVRTEELDNLNQILVKQLKTRYANKATKLRFVLGVDVSKQKFYDIDAEHEADVLRGSDMISVNRDELRKKFGGFQQ